MKIDWKKIAPYLVALVVFIGFALIYCSPILEGKVLQAGDVSSWQCASHEAQEYHQETGEYTWWTNSMFGGMPTFQITGNMPSGEVRSGIFKMLRLGFTDGLESIGLIFAYFFGFRFFFKGNGIFPRVNDFNVPAAAGKTYGKGKNYKKDFFHGITPLLRLSNLGYNFTSV